MCLNNPQILCFCGTECKDLWTSSGKSLWCPSSVPRILGWSEPGMLEQLHLLLSRALARVTPSPAVLTFLKYKKISFSIVGHVVGASRGNTEEGQKGEAAFACFLNQFHSIKKNLFTNGVFCCPGKFHVMSPCQSQDASFVLQ